VAAVKPPKEEEVPEYEPKEYPGAMGSVLQDICEAAGFAFAEVWTRPKFEVPAPDGQGVQVQWDHLLKYGDVTYINYSAFPEARNLAGKLDDFKSSGRDVSYARNNSIPGLAWNRHDVDWQDLSVYDVLDETLQADPRISLAMEMFDASIALPVLHPVYKKLSAVLVFYRNRHVTNAAAVCNAPEYYNHPALVALFNNAKDLAPLALEYEQAMPQWHQIRESCRHEFDTDTGGVRQKDGNGHDLRGYEEPTSLIGYLRSRAATTVSLLKRNENFQKLSSMEAEWEKGKLASWLVTYTNKWKGAGGAAAKGTDFNYCKWVFFGSICAIGAMTFIDDMVDEYTYNDAYTLYALVTHFSAVALILFSTPTSPYGQPRNVIGGHVLSAVIAVVMDSNKEFFGVTQVMMNALAPTTAIGAMTWTGLMHPPAAACCFIFVSGGPRIKNLGYLYIFFPVLLDVGIMLFLALVINNACETRKYPVYW